MIVLLINGNPLLYPVVKVSHSFGYIVALKDNINVAVITAAPVCHLDGNERTILTAFSALQKACYFRRRLYLHKRERVQRTGPDLNCSFFLNKYAYNYSKKCKQYSSDIE